MKASHNIFTEIQQDLAKCGHDVEWIIKDEKPHLHFKSKYSPVLIWALQLKYNGILMC